MKRKRTDTTTTVGDDEEASSTPSRRAAAASNTPAMNGTPRTPRRQILTDDLLVRNADKSARRKTARAIINRVTRDDYSDAEGGDVGSEEEELEREIYSEDGGEEEEVDDARDRDGDEEDDEGDGPMGVLDRGLLSDDEQGAGRKRGRPAGATVKTKRGRRKEKSPELQLEGLPPHEVYFEQHRKRPPMSTNSISSVAPLETSRLFELLREHKDHEEEKETLIELYQANFTQWLFELSQGFNLMLYGYGSKRSLLQQFLERLHTHHPTRKILVVNGHVPNLAIKDILLTILAALLGPSHGIKVGANLNDTVTMILSLLSQDDTPSLTLAIHNIDGENLRSEKSQTILSTLAAHSKISLVASVDHIRAPVLWDSARASQLNLIWHEATTFQPYDIESSVVQSLEMGRSGRTGGTKGVKYVLASLPTNARELYRILISSQLEAIAEDDDGGRNVGEAHERYGVDYKILYQRAAEEFICSNDVAFRSLLKEFQDHEMVTSRKDVQGAEILWAPFRKEELANILEDIIS